MKNKNGGTLLGIVAGIAIGATCVGGFVLIRNSFKIDLTEKQQTSIEEVVNTSKEENVNKYIKFEKSNLVGGKNIKIERVGSFNADVVMETYVSVNYQVKEDGKTVNWEKTIVDNAEDITGLKGKTGTVKLPKEAVMVFAGAVGNGGFEKVCVLYADGTVAELKTENGTVVVGKQFTDVKDVVRFEQISTRYVEGNETAGSGALDIAAVEKNGDIKILDFKNATYFK